MQMAFPRVLRASLQTIKPRHALPTIRRYATQQQQGQGKKGSEMPIGVAVATATAAGAYYLLGPSGTPNPKHRGHHAGDETQIEEAEKREATLPAGQSLSEPDRDATQTVTSGVKRGESLDQAPSTVDAASARKEPGGIGTMSRKQEGLSNATTDNPFINEPGKSKKGEGETETAKVKGTVSPNREQV